MIISDKKKSIVWLTADYFLDSDMQIVPMLKQKFNIIWFIIRNERSQREVSFAKEADEIISVKHRSLSPLCIFSYIHLIKKIKKYNPDILYIDYLGMPYFFPVLDKMFDINKVIFMAHNVKPRPTWNWQYRWYYPFIFHHIKNVHVPSTHNFSYMDEHYPNLKYTYIPMAVKSFGKASVGRIDDGKTRFLFFGHVMKNKHLDHLIEAFCGLSEEDKMKSELYVYGKCLTPDIYENMAQEEKTIHLNFGYVPNEQIPALFTSSSYLVLPYDNVDQSGPSMIAFNYNLPLICSDIEGFREIVNDGKDGFLYKRDDVQDLRQVLHRSINMTDLEYQTIRRNQKDNVEKTYSLEVISQKYSDMFNNL